MTKKIIILLLLLTGCCQNNKEYMCQVQPIIIMKNGASSWNDERLKLSQVKAQLIFNKVGLYFDFLQPIYKEDELLYICDSNYNYYQINQMATDIEKQFSKIAVFYVEDLIWSGKNRGGLSTFPWSKGRGIIIASDYFGITLPHELGHYFGLHHPWEDKLPDTTSNGPKDCSTEDKELNIMGYCERRRYGFYATKALTKCQRSEIRKWMNLPPRKNILKERTKPLQ